jgi:molybdate transport system ATP-binding protein
MVLIARAMVKTPQLLILDEPCSGLDSDNRRQVLWLVESIAGNGLPGLIFMTHHRHEIPRCTTHRLVLNHGNVLLNQNGRESLCE